MRNAKEYRGGRRVAGRFLCMLFAGWMAVSEPMTAMATNTAQMEQEKREAQQQLDAAQAQADAAQAQREAAEAVVEELQEELAMLIAEISLLESDIEAKEDQIKEAEKEYDAAKKREEEQYQDMKKRIKYMYEKGETEYLDILFKVESMADLLNKSEYIADIYEYDRKMLEEYKQTKLQVEEYKTQLENDKAEMEGMQIEFAAQKENLELTIQNKRREVSNFDETYAKAKRKAEVFARTVAEKNAQIRQAEEEARRKAEEEARRRAEEEARKKAEEEARKKAEEDARKRAEEESREAERNRQETSGTSPVAPGGDSETSGTTPGGNQSSGNTSYGPGGSGSKSSSYGPGMVNGSAQGRAVVDYAMKFIGNPYVYGGTSLTDGADCSGFVQSVYKHFGITLPRTSAEQRSAGRGVEYADAQPGDLICYAGHIGIYIGNGQIVHASSPKNGIKVGNATYRTILAVRRIVD